MIIKIIYYRYLIDRLVENECHFKDKNTRLDFLSFSTVPWFMFKCGNALLLLASGKCAYVSCKISDWNPWKGELPKDGCAQQIRTKDVTTTQHEKIQAENCQGLQTTCPEVPPETRTWCKDLNLLLI